MISRLFRIAPSRLWLSVGVLLLGLTPACALRPPVENSGSLAKDGVQVSVVGQRCTETVEPEWPGANLVQTVVQMQVANSTTAPVTIQREQLHLRGLDGRRVPSRGWSSAEPLTVGSGQTTTFQVEFMTRGGMSCTRPMQLDAESGISVGAEPLRLGSVTFVPSHA